MGKVIYNFYLRNNLHSFHSSSKNYSLNIVFNDIKFTKYYQMKQQIRNPMTNKQMMIKQIFLDIHFPCFFVLLWIFLLGIKRVSLRLFSSGTVFISWLPFER